MRFQTKRWTRQGFTLVELLAAASIICIFLAMAWPTLGNVRERAEKVVCVGHLRSLYCSLGGYLNDHEEWPQCPDELSESQREQFWIDTVKEYGSSEKTWLCPTMSRNLSTATEESGIKKVHYDVTPFDDNPMSPRKWGFYPWLVEKGNMHYSGALMIRSDGGIQTLTDLAGAVK